MLIAVDTLLLQAVQVLLGSSGGYIYLSSSKFRSNALVASNGLNRNLLNCCQGSFPREPLFLVAIHGISNLDCSKEQARKSNMICKKLMKAKRCEIDGYIPSKLLQAALQKIFIDWPYWRKCWNCHQLPERSFFLGSTVSAMYPMHWHRDRSTPLACLASCLQAAHGYICVLNLFDNCGRSYSALAT